MKIKRPAFLLPILTACFLTSCDSLFSDNVGHARIIYKNPPASSVVPPAPAAEKPKAVTPTPAPAPKQAPAIEEKPAQKQLPVSMMPAPDEPEDQDEVTAESTDPKQSLWKRLFSRKQDEATPEEALVQTAPLPDPVEEKHGGWFSQNQAETQAEPEEATDQPKKSRFTRNQKDAEPKPAVAEEEKQRKSWFSQKQEDAVVNPEPKPEEPTPSRKGLFTQRQAKVAVKTQPFPEPQVEKPAKPARKHLFSQKQAENTAAPAAPQPQAQAQKPKRRWWSWPWRRKADNGQPRLTRRQRKLMQEEQMARAISGSSTTSDIPEYLLEPESQNSANQKKKH